MRFLLIDRITSWDPGRSATAVKNVALSEDFFDDHFPLKPVMPGVLLIEGMAQLGGVLLEHGVRRDTGRNVKCVLTIVEKAKFRSPVLPGDCLEYRAEVDSVNEYGGKVSATASRSGKRVAECTLVFGLYEGASPGLVARSAEVMSLWLQGLKGDEPQ
jgi:3-hydroxyacyl-[acyl-carrier-protein] dehydratase